MPSYSVNTGILRADVNLLFKLTYELIREIKKSILNPFSETTATQYVEELRIQKPSECIIIKRSNVVT